MSALPITTAGPIGDRGFVLTRSFVAPRELVFRCWTEPAHLARWWGPSVFTNPVCELDLQPGGRYRIVMRSPDGQDYPLTGEFVEITPPERLVLTMEHEQPGELYGATDPHRVRVLTTVTFEEQDGRTDLTVTQRFDTTAERDVNLRMRAAEGWGSSFETLDALLAELGAG